MLNQLYVRVGAQPRTATGDEVFLTKLPQWRGMHHGLRAPLDPSLPRLSGMEVGQSATPTGSLIDR